MQKSNALNCKYLLTLFQYHSVLVTLVIARTYVQLVLENEAHHTNLSYHCMSIPMVFKVHLFLHSLSVLNEALKHGTSKVAQPYVTGTLIWYCVQLVTKPWSQLLNFSCVD